MTAIKTGVSFRIKWSNIFCNYEGLLTFDGTMLLIAMADKLNLSQTVAAGKINSVLIYHINLCGKEIAGIRKI